MKLNILSLFALVAIIAFAGCTSYGGQKGDDNQIPTPPADDKVSGDAEAREITITGTEFSFNPSTISVTKGEKIRLTFKNSGTVIHNLNIDELSIATKTIPAGETDVVEFTADKSGTFTYYCGVGSHRAKGMEGTLTSGE